MGWTTAGLLGLLVLWLGAAAAVTIWALRARRTPRIDLTTAPEGLHIVDRIDLTDVPVDDAGDVGGGQRRRA